MDFINIFIERKFNVKKLRITVIVLLRARANNETRVKRLRLQVLFL